MTKTPEEYFQEQEFQPEPDTGAEGFTEAEKAFLEKYLGLEEPGILEKLGIDAPVETSTVPVPAAQEETSAEAFEPVAQDPGPAPEEALEQALEQAPEIQDFSEPADELEQAAQTQEPTEAQDADRELQDLEAVAEEDVPDVIDQAIDEALAGASEELEPTAEPEQELQPAESLEAEQEPQLAAEHAKPEEQELQSENEPLAQDQQEPEDLAVVSEALETLPQEEEQELEDRLRQQNHLQLVSFYVGRHEYTLPIEAVQEVVRAVKPAKVPEAPDYLAGLVNLRGRVTPLVRPDVLLGVERGQSADQDHDDGEDHFIIVCSQGGLQVGLLVRRVATMYHVKQSDIEWNIESRLGGAVELVTALMRRQDDSLVGIVSIDRLVQRLLKR